MPASGHHDRARGTEGCGCRWNSGAAEWRPAVLGAPRPTWAARRAPSPSCSSAATRDQPRNPRAGSEAAAPSRCGTTGSQLTGYQRTMPVRSTTISARLANRSGDIEAPRAADQLAETGAIADSSHERGGAAGRQIIRGSSRIRCTVCRLLRVIGRVAPPRLGDWRSVQALSGIVRPRRRDTGSADPPHRGRHAQIGSPDSRTFKCSIRCSAACGAQVRPAVRRHQLGQPCGRHAGASARTLRLPRAVRRYGPPLQRAADPEQRNRSSAPAPCSGPGPRPSGLTGVDRGPVTVPHDRRGPRRRLHRDAATAMGRSATRTATPADHPEQRTALRRRHHVVGLDRDRADRQLSIRAPSLSARPARTTSAVRALKLHRGRSARPRGGRSAPDVSGTSAMESCHGAPALSA